MVSIGDIVYLSHRCMVAKYLNWINKRKFVLQRAHFWNNSSLNHYFSCTDDVGFNYRITYDLSPLLSLISLTSNFRSMFFFLILFLIIQLGQGLENPQTPSVSLPQVCPALSLFLSLSPSRICNSDNSFRPPVFDTATNKWKRGGRRTEPEPHHHHSSPRISTRGLGNAQHHCESERQFPATSSTHRHYQRA